MKAMVRTMGMITLLMLAGCENREKRERLDGFNNEVLMAIRRVRGQGVGVRCIEREDPEAQGNHDVLLQHSAHVLQSYRIEDHTVTQFYCAELDYESMLDCVGNEYCHTFGLIWQLPNALKPDSAPVVILDGHAAVTIVDMGWSIGISKEKPPNFLEGAVLWDDVWFTWKWAGDAHDVTPPIEVYQQRALQAVCLPEHRKEYPSYVRAVPLLTQEDMEAEKETPLIDLEKTRYHAKCAVAHPYTLFPVPEKRSPFPAVKTYAPGDKFSVISRSGFFLIETFKGE